MDDNNPPPIDSSAPPPDDSSPPVNSSPPPPDDSSPPPPPPDNSSPPVDSSPPPPDSSSPPVDSSPPPPDDSSPPSPPPDSSSPPPPDNSPPPDKSSPPVDSSPPPPDDSSPPPSPPDDSSPPPPDNSSPPVDSFPPTPYDSSPPPPPPDNSSPPVRPPPDDYPPPPPASSKVPVRSAPPPSSSQLPPVASVPSPPQHPPLPSPAKSQVPVVSLRPPEISEVPLMRSAPPSPQVHPSPPDHDPPTPSVASDHVPVPSHPSSIPATAIAVGFASVVVVLVLGILGWVYIRRKRARTQGAGEAAEEAQGHSPPARQSSVSRVSQRGYFSILQPSSADARSFSFEELSIATGNFNESELLGRGGFGSVYKGKLDDEDGALVAIKRIEESSSQGVKEFRAEVTIIRELRHRNLVRLRGWCHDKGTLLLVYDYMPNGSLDRHLFDDTLCAKLNWEKRDSIALGLGSALQYLHEECEKVIIHRDIKSSNVLLDESFNAKLGDFGLARQVVDKSVMTTAAGTHGYMAPECLIGMRGVMRETDMYAFGAVLLELVCGKPAFDPTRFQDILLVEWVWRLHGQDRLMEAVDKRLQGMYDKEKARRMLMVGMACSFPDPKARPKIRHAIDALMGSMPPPLVPLSRPPIILFGSSSSSSSATTTSTTSSSISSS